MYDALTSTYTLSCPNRGESRVRLSAFRALDRLPGAAHPAVYRVDYACSCGEEHPALVSHDELDWAPLGLAGGSFLNLMTSRPTRSRRSSAITRRGGIKAGRVAVELLLLPEERPRPLFPSSFFLLRRGGLDRTRGALPGLQLGLRQPRFDRAR